MAQQRLRIRLRAFDHKSLDRTAQQIVEIAEQAGSEVAGPIPRPTRVERFTVIRSSQLSSVSREQFEIRTHKRLVDVLDPTPRTLEALSHLNIPTGVDAEMEIAGPSRSSREARTRRQHVDRAGARNKDRPSSVRVRTSGHLTGRIRYRPVTDEVADPFGVVPGERQIQDTSEFGERGRKYEALVEWASAVGRGTWYTLVQASTTLGLDNDGTGRETRRVVRNLRLLGHIETGAGGTRWSITPTTLIAIEHERGQSELSRFVLSGARSPELLKTLRNTATVEFAAQPGGNGPPAIVVHALPEDLGSKLTNTDCAVVIRIEPDASLSLARALPTIEDWASCLSPLPNLSPDIFDCRRWDGQRFAEEPFTGAAGLYELWTPERMGADRNDGRRPVYTALYNGKSGQWVRGEWYGMRFLAQICEGRKCPVRIGNAADQLAIPLSWRWPEIYERALVLCSGRLPSLAWDRGQASVIYQNVREDVVGVLTTKLHLVSCLRNS